VTKTCRDIEAQILNAQRATKGASAVSLALQAIKEAVDADSAISTETRSLLETLICFGEHANFFSMSLPLNQLVADTATLREATLRSNRSIAFSTSMAAPYVNTTLFPTQTKLLLRSAQTARNEAILTTAVVIRLGVTLGVLNSFRRYGRYAKSNQGRQNDSFKPSAYVQPARTQAVTRMGYRSRPNRGGYVMPSDKNPLPRQPFRLLCFSKLETATGSLSAR
jgi:hypothetical protein